MAKTNGHAGDDLTDLDTVNETWLTIIKPGGQPMLGADGQPWRIKVASELHAVTLRAQTRAQERTREVLQQLGEIPEAKSIEIATEQLAARVLDWTPTRRGSEEFPCTRENAIETLKRSDVVRRQVEDFLSRASNFLATRALASSPTPGSTSPTASLSTGPAAAQ